MDGRNEMVIVEVETVEQQKTMSDCVKLGKLLCEHGETLPTILAHALVSYDHAIIELADRVIRLQESGCNMAEEEMVVDRMEDFKLDLLHFIDSIQ